MEKTMKRTPFKRKPPAPYVKPERASPIYDRIIKEICMPRVGGEVNPQPKENAIYCEPYRRLVAARPCIHCGIEGYSQAAHPPPTAKGRKEDDRLVFPLCCTREGVTGCHSDYDLYRLIPPAEMREVAAKWGVQTRKEIRDEGKWPHGLPHMETQTELEITA